jgi:site-specific DNA recombinase
MDNRRKTAIYCRVALTDKGKIAAQEARLRAYAGEHGYGDIICHRDCGAAGTTLDRPAMNRLVAEIKAGEIGTVITADVSRIARTYPLAMEWRELTRKHGVTFVALADFG